MDRNSQQSWALTFRRWNRSLLSPFHGSSESRGPTPRNHLACAGLLSALGELVTWGQGAQTFLQAQFKGQGIMNNIREPHPFLLILLKSGLWNLKFLEGSERELTSTDHRQYSWHQARRHTILVTCWSSKHCLHGFVPGN